MSDSTPIRFGIGNTLRDAVMSSSPRPVSGATANVAETTPRRLTKWSGTNEADQIVITAIFSQEQRSRFMALTSPASIGNAEVKLELYRADSGATVDRLGMPWTSFTRYEDTQGMQGRLPDIFNYWFDDYASYDTARLFIRPMAGESLVDVEMTNFIIGDYYEMKTGMAFPHGISFMSPPRTRLLSSGRSVNISRRVKSKAMNVPLPFSTIEDRNALVNLEIQIGDDPFVVAAFPDSAEPWMLNDYSMLGILGNSILHTQVAVGIHSQTLNILEA